MPPLHQHFKETFQTMIPCLKGWRTTVKSATQDRQVKKYLAESDNLLKQEEIEKMKCSKPYTDGLNVLKLVHLKDAFTQPEVTAARDLLLVKFSLTTRTRPGALNNATLDDYRNALVYQGNKIMLVAKHKRSKDGPAMLGMDRELQELMGAYAKYIRPKLAKSGVNSLFVKNDGKEFPEGTIGKRLTEFWRKSRVRPDRMSHTDLRKFIATTTVENAPESSETVHKVMSHSAITAKRSYVRTQLTKTASQAMTFIKDVTSKPTEDISCAVTTAETRRGKPRRHKNRRPTVGNLGGSS